MRLLKNLPLASVIFYVITQFWIFIEMKMYGMTFPSDADTVIAFILSTSIYINIKLLSFKSKWKDGDFN